MTGETGIVRAWDDDRGFGFIGEGQERVFLHISEFRRNSGRPAVGMRVRFTRSRDERGRARALSVRPLNTSRVRPGRSGRQARDTASRRALAVGVVLGMLLAYLVQSSRLPPLVPLVYLLASVISYFLYASDKRAAQSGHWRTKESTLHLWALAGGWPGALLAQARLRHKSRKGSFRFVFWLTVILNLAGLLYLLGDEGARWLQETLPHQWLYPALEWGG